MAEALPCHAGVLDPAASTEVADPRHAVSWHARARRLARSQLAMEGRTAGYAWMQHALLQSVSCTVMHCHALSTVMTVS